MTWPILSSLVSSQTRLCLFLFALGNHKVLSSVSWLYFASSCFWSSWKQSEMRVEHGKGNRGGKALVYSQNWKKTVLVRERLVVCSCRLWWTEGLDFIYDELLKRFKHTFICMFRKFTVGVVWRMYRREAKVALRSQDVAVQCLVAGTGVWQRRRKRRMDLKCIFEM